MRNPHAATLLPVLLLTLGCLGPVASAQTLSIGGLKIRLGPDRRNTPPPNAAEQYPHPGQVPPSGSYGGSGGADRYGNRLASDDDKQAAADAYAEGNRLMKAGRDADAERKFQEAVGRDPQDANAYNQLALLSMNAKQYGTALVWLKDAVRYNPALEPAYYNAGVIYGKKSSGRYYDPAGAIRTFTKAIQLNPKDEQAWAWRGWEYGDTGQYRKAVYDCKKALTLDPKDAQVYCTLGEQQLKLGQDDKVAYANLRQSRTLNPGNGPMVANVIRLALAKRTARSKFLAHRAEIASVVHAGPRYYENVYREARREGESPEEASRREQEARDTYDRDVALQDAWEAGDTNMVERIEAGEVTKQEIAVYDSSNTPRGDNGGGGDSGGGGNSGGDNGGGGDSGGGDSGGGDSGGGDSGGGGDNGGGGEPPPGGE